MKKQPLAAAGVAVSSLLLLTACISSTTRADAPADLPAATVTANVDDGAQDVPVDTLVEVDVQDGTVTETTLVAADDDGTAITGEGGDASWRAGERLEPGTRYTLTVEAKGADGEVVTASRAFETVDLTLDQQTYPSVAPLQGETVGVGMPVVVAFDLPVTDRALYEKHMAVRSSAEVEGSWHWISDRLAHYRPKEFWPAGADVTVDLDLNSLPAGEGIYGQQDQHVEFEIGRSAVTTVDVANHRLTYSVDGKDVRTIPVSTGKPGNETRGGTKVIMEKFASVDMDAASTGVDPSDPDYYDISDVQWAMRVTNSGEFIHAAPWSVGSQGNANVSHGCVGMSTADAKWLYDRSMRGDVVEFVNSDRGLEDHNGWTDWNLDWDDWVAGSALAES